MIDNIIKVICDGEQVSFDDIKTDSRKADLNYPRQLIMYFAREMNIGSLAAIGRTLDRDHATVLHSIKSINNYIATDSRKRDRIEEYRKQLTGIEEVTNLRLKLENDLIPVKYDISACESRLINLRIELQNIENIIEKMKL